MSLWTANLPNLVIASSATDTTTAITASLEDAESVTIVAPSALTGTVTIKGSVDGGTTYVDVGSGGTDVTIGAGNAVTLSPFTFNALKVTSGSAEAAERTFTVLKQFRVGR